MTTIMADLTQLIDLLNDPQTRELVRGLAAAHGDASHPPHLPHTVERIDEATTGERVGSWLSDEPNRQLTPTEVRTAFGDDALADLAAHLRIEPAQAAHQLATVLPELIDSASRGGHPIDAGDVEAALGQAMREGPDTAGPFGR